MNNLIVNTNKNAQIIKLHFHIEFTNSPTCFELLQIILREFYISKHIQNTDSINNSSVYYTIYVFLM